MTPQEMNEFLDRLFAATGTGDWETAATMLTDDLVITEADGLPMEGVFRGVDGLKELYNKVFATLEVASLDHLARTFGENCAIAVARMNFAGEGLESAELCELFRFRDGKVCEIKPYYFHQAPLLAAAAAKAEA